MTPDPAFSAVANDYDATFTDTAVGRLQRTAVWNLLANQLGGTPSVLELNCGTGADAIWMAQHGWQVLATDISAEMVQVANEKIGGTGLTHKATAKVAAFAEIAQLEEGPFDLIFSNFGGLNCISPTALEELGTVLHAKLNPGGQIIAIVMGRFCCWETLYFLLKMNPRQAFRRLRRGPTKAQLDAQTSIETWYYSPAQFRNFFSEYGVVAIRPIGFWLPPSYLDPFFSKRPRLLRCLRFLENHCAPGWLAGGADHFLIQLKKPD